ATGSEGCDVPLPRGGLGLAIEVSFPGSRAVRYRRRWPHRRASEVSSLPAGPAMLNQVPSAVIPAARVSARTISLSSPVPITPVLAVSALPMPPPAPFGPSCARPARGTAGAGVTTGNRLARLPVGLGADRPGTVPRGNCGGRVSGPVTPGSGVGAPLATDLLGMNGPERDGDGLCDGDGGLLGEGDGLGEGDLLGEGDGDLL